MEHRSVTVAADVMGQAITEALAQGGSFLLTVTGNSMRPTLVPGRDQVCLCAPVNLKKGDIIFFRRPTGEYILHRIIRLCPEEITVNGDSQTWTERVLPGQVIGVVSRVLRNGKWVDTQSAAARAYSLLWPKTRSLRPGLIRLKQKLRK